MKKLMTMIAAVATAFGLYAADGDIDSFDAAAQGATLTDGQWTLNNEVITTDIPEAAITDSKVVFQTNGKAVGRNFNENLVPVAVEEAVYLDTEINFQAPFDEVPEVASGAKIAAFVLDNSGLLEDQPNAKVQPSTNLYAFASFWNGEAWEKRAFMFDTANAGLASGVEKRLTVKIYENVLASDTYMGFRFFLEGVEGTIKNALKVACVFKVDETTNAIDFENDVIVADDPETPYLGCEASALKAEVRSRATSKDRSLVISLEQSTAELTALDFVGKGALGSLLLTANKPSFIEEDDQTMAVDYEHATFASISGNADISDDKKTITFYDDSQITLTVTPSENYTIVKWFLNEGETPVATGTSYQFTPVKGNELYVKAFKEEATLTYIEDQEEKTVNCTSVIDAFTQAGELGDVTDVVIKLGQFAGTDGVITIADADQSIYGIDVNADGKEITLDLAGKKLKGGDDGLFNVATISVTAGNLTVMDSVGGGAILDPVFTTEDTPYAIGAVSGGLLFTDDDYTVGTISEDAFGVDTFKIAGGKYTKTNEKEDIQGALADPDTLEVVDEVTVWTVQAAAPKDYVAKIGDDQFETFEEAVAALKEDDQTIELIKEATLATAVTPAYNVTFDMGGFTLNAKLEKAITCSAGKTLNVTNGTIAISHGSYTIEVYGTLNVLNGARIEKDNTSGPVFDVYDTATINVEDGAYLSNGGVNQVFRFKDEYDTSNCTYTVNVKGGTIDGANANLFEVYKPGATATIAISGGTINATTMLRVGDDSKAASATVNLTISGGTINATTANFSVGTDSTLNCTLDGTCAAKFKVDQGLNDYCEDGYKAKLNGEWYEIAAIQYATYKVTTDEGVESYVVSNGTAAVEAGAQFDIDDNVTLTVYPTLKANYELVTDECVLSAALTEAKVYELKVVTKAATAPDPVDGDLTEDGRTNLATLKTVLGATDINTWAAKIYDNGLIPAEKLNTTTEDLIAISVKYDLPILGATPTIEIAAATDGAFTFQIKDAGTAIELKRAMDKILSMVEFTDDLATTEFAPQTTETNVTVALKEDDTTTATVEFTKETDAGFMRVNLTK